MEKVKNIAVEAMEKAQHLYVLFSLSTRHPFIIYDQNMQKDRIYLYVSQELAMPKLQELERYGYRVDLADLPMASRAMIFTNYHALGIDEVVFRDEHSTTVLDLSEIRKIDIMALPKEQRPHLNPALQISSIFFLQEMTRMVPEEALSESDRRAREDLDREFGKQLVRSRFMVPVQVKKVHGAKPGTRISQKNLETVFVRDRQGLSWLPVFSDVTEFELFNSKGQYQAVLVEFAQLSRMLGNELTGCILNPESQSYALVKEVLEELQGAY